MRVAAVLICLALFSSTHVACGSGETVSTYPGTYHLTFTATATQQGCSTATTHTLDLTLNVTPYRQ